MNRRFKRQVIARTVSVLAVAIPAALGAAGAITVHTLYGWEGKAAGVFFIGAAFSVGFGVIVGAAWSEYYDVVHYPALYKGRSSWLRDWIEEPEENKVEIPKPKPRPEAWKEE